MCPRGRNATIAHHAHGDASTGTGAAPENKAALVERALLARMGLSEELADAVVFFASGEASFITGHVHDTSRVEERVQ
jgi:NAD(P)-dependent dehydrogenase (short-subunit alcohol dehydrogenase family)